MRIISEEHDYYDSFMSLDQDRETLYIRKQSNQVVKMKSPEARMMPEWPSCPGTYHHATEWLHTISSIHYSMVGFCKKIHPVVKIWHKREQGQSEQKYTICFNMEDVDAFFHEHFKEKELDEWKAKARKRNYFFLGWSSMTRRVSWVEFFEKCDKLRDKHVSLFEQLQTPIFEYKWSVRLEDGWRNNEWTLILNPLLSKLEFYRLYAGYQAYQELVMYFGNLASPEKPIPKIDDKTLAEIKGFDKFSFRKDKSK